MFDNNLTCRKPKKMSHVDDEFTLKIIIFNLKIAKLPSKKWSDDEMPSSPRSPFVVVLESFGTST